MNEENKKTEIEYILSQRKKGGTDEAIKKELLSAGWTEDDISIGFSEADKISVANKKADNKDIKKSGSSVSSKTEELGAVRKEGSSVDDKVTSGEELKDPVVKFENGVGESVIKTIVTIIVGLLILAGVAMAIYFLLGAGAE